MAASDSWSLSRLQLRRIYNGSLPSYGGMVFDDPMVHLLGPVAYAAAANGMHDLRREWNASAVRAARGSRQGGAGQGGGG